MITNNFCCKQLKRNTPELHDHPRTYIDLAAIEC